MTLIVDASALYGQADRHDPAHRAILGALDAETGPLVVSQIVVAEADYMILDRLGIDAELAFLDDLASRAFQVECLTPAELQTAREIVARYRDLSIGVADASLVVLSSRFRTRRIVTSDERHFRAITPLQGESFTILPADGS
ncbi:MAG TPA: PIN domain-containing protein [Chloroflexota bacterium]|nr:PIN domain-containing protein [Chloroflexota bacterium]